MRGFMAGTIALFTILAVPVASGEPAGGGAGRLLDDGDGVQTASFDTLSGTVTVHLPDDIAAGDTISGTVVAEPSGDKDKKRKKNLDTLTGWVLETGGRRTGVGDGRLTVEVPRPASGSDPVETVSLVLREVRDGRPGREIGRVEVPVRDAAVSVAGFDLPAVGQPGRVLRVRGPFDGRLGSTSLSVGGVDAIPLAESPRAAAFRSPREIVGISPIELREHGRVVARGELRNVAVGLSAPKLDLLRGESTVLSTVVTGLEDLEQEIAFTLRVWPEPVVAVEGGHRRKIVIRPESVRPDGTWSLDIALTGRGAGRWNAEATVETPEPPPVDRYVLVLEGEPVGTLNDVAGGTIPGSVSVQGPGPDDLARKHVDTISSEAVVFEVGMAVGKPLYDWIRDSIASGGVRRSGEIVGVDRTGAAREVHEFHRAVIDSVTFPRLDPADASPAFLTVAIAPESVRYVEGSGEKVAPVKPAGRVWRRSDFRFELGGLPVDPVRAVDAFTWSRPARDGAPAAGLEPSGVRLTIATSDPAAWNLWHRAFGGAGRATGDALDGRLVFLDPARNALATVELHDAATATLTVGPAEAGPGEARPMTIELVDSRLTFIP